jgi:hypothetical protein
MLILALLFTMLAMVAALHFGVGHGMTANPRPTEDFSVVMFFAGSALIFWGMWGGING